MRQRKSITADKEGFSQSQPGRQLLKAFFQSDSDYSVENSSVWRRWAKQVAGTPSWMGPSQLLPWRLPKCSIAFGGRVRRTQILSHFRIFFFFLFRGEQFTSWCAKDNLRLVLRLFPSWLPFCLLCTKCAHVVFVPWRLAVSKARRFASLPLDVHQFRQAGGRAPLYCNGPEDLTWTNGRFSVRHVQLLPPPPLLADF